MEGEKLLFRLVVDGKPVADKVPGGELAALLEAHGVRSAPHTMLDGRVVRVLGQNLQLQKWVEGSPPPSLDLASLPTKESPDMPSRPPSRFDSAISEMKQRADKFCRNAFAVSIAATLMLVGYGVYSFLGFTAEPSTVIDQIHVPDVIAKAFAVGESLSGVSFLHNVESSVHALLTGPIIKVLSAIAMILGIVMVMLNGRLSGIVAAVAIGGTPYVIEPILDDVLLSDSPNAFSSAVESKSLPELQQLLSSRSDLDEVATTYVLAQASVANDLSSKWVVLTAENIRSGKLKPPAEISYALEATAYGSDIEQMSEPARLHWQKAKDKAAGYKSNASKMAIAAVTASLIGVGLSSIMLVMRRRLRRIEELLGQLG